MLALRRKWRRATLLGVISFILSDRFWAIIVKVENTLPAKREQTWYSCLTISGDLAACSRSWSRRLPRVASHCDRIVPTRLDSSWVRAV